MSSQKTTSVQMSSKDSHWKSDDKNCQNIVVSFGRMNPPTVGHIRLMNRMVSVADELNATPMLFLSHTKDSNNNPLSYEQKLKYVRSASPKGLFVMKSDSKNIYDAIHQINKRAKSNKIKVYVVSGSDRMDDYELLKKYAGQTVYKKYKNGKEKYSNYQNIESIELISAGIRNENSDDTDIAISGSKLREYIKNNDYDSYYISAGCSDELKNDMYVDVESALHMKA